VLFFSERRSRKDEGCTVSYFYSLLSFFDRRRRTFAGSTAPSSTNFKRRRNLKEEET